MKRIYLFTLTLLLLLQSTCSVWVILSFYLQRNYIEKNLCENRFAEIPICRGACYLKKELSKQEAAKSNTPNFKIKETELFSNFQIVTYNLFVASNRLLKSTTPYKLQLIKTYLASPYHPPQ
jgi:hypothetical protein